MLYTEDPKCCALLHKQRAASEDVFWRPKGSLVGSVKKKLMDVCAREKSKRQTVWGRFLFFPIL